MRKQFMLLCVLVISIPCLSQNIIQAGGKVKKPQLDSEYDRNSLTYLLLDFGDNGFNDILKKSFKSIKVNDKFDDNTIERQFLQPPIKREEILKTQFFNPTIHNSITDKIASELVKGKYTNDVIAKWFSRKPDGSFGVELLQERGLYNSTDADVKAANSSKLGMAKLMDSGEKLLNKSYLVVFDASDLISKEEYYNRQDKNSKTPVKRDRNGFLATINAYIFKIDFNDSINAVFWQQLWADKTDPGLNSKKVAFDNFSFPVKYISRLTTSSEASQYNPEESAAPKIQKTKDELMTELLSTSVNNAILVLERSLEAFRVKTSLYATKPPRAKIGSKENLKIDQRYFVYEMRLGSKGEVKTHRQGVIRATNKITDNRNIATGKTVPSVFYQVAGKRLDEGMLLQQRNDLGLALGIGYSSGGVGGLTGKLDINISSFFKKKVPSMIKLFLEGGYEPKDIHLIIDSSNEDYNDLFRFGLGLGKEFCLLRNFRIQPFASLGLEELSDKNNSKKSLSSLYEHGGIMAGINILHNLQLVGSYNYYFMKGKITDQDKVDYTIDGYSKWGDAFNRGGTAYDLGLRIEF
jgi:hypothetical protein